MHSLAVSQSGRLFAWGLLHEATTVATGLTSEAGATAGGVELPGVPFGPAVSPSCCGIAPTLFLTGTSQRDGISTARPECICLHTPLTAPCAHCTAGLAPTNRSRRDEVREIVARSERLFQGLNSSEPEVCRRRPSSTRVFGTAGAPLGAPARPPGAEPARSSSLSLSTTFLRR